jgi:muramoyltetrapeptide carboxypeptidase
MNLKKPPKLNAGDSLGVIAPSDSVIPFKKMYQQGIENLRSLGFNVKEGKTPKLQHGSMAGTDVQRAEDINSMFSDKEIKAIICARGGASAIRTLRYLDYDVINTNPKVFCGMSDITTLHVAFLAKTGLVGLHQTNVMTCFGFGADMRSKEAEYEANLFLKVVTNARRVGLLPPLTRWEAWRSGVAQGRLFGGNLGAVESLLATPYFPKLDEDVILFWEAVKRPIEQVLVHFREAGLFDRTRGMLIGKIRNEEDGRVRDTTSEVKEAVLDITEEFGFPIIAGMDFGHFTPNLPLPLGLKAAMDTDGTKVLIDESYVK